MNPTLHSIIHRFINRHLSFFLCLCVLLCLIPGSFSQVYGLSYPIELPFYGYSRYGAYTLDDSNSVIAYNDGSSDYRIGAYRDVQGTASYVSYLILVGSQYYGVWDGSQTMNFKTSDNTYNLTRNDSTTGLRYCSLKVLPSGATNYIASYSDLATGLQAVRDYIDNPPSPVILSYSFDNGYLFVVDVGLGSSYDFALSSVSETYSTWLSGTFPDTNQSYWFTDTLPTTNDSIPPVGDYSLIVWERGDSRNIFGQSYEMVSSLSGVAPGRYLCLYNPPVHTKWSNGSNPSSNSVDNNPVTVSGLTNQGFWIFDTSAQLVYSGTGSNPIYLDATIVGDYGLGVISDGAITVVDTSGNPYVQTPGGSTDISGASGGTLQENIRGLQQTLNDLVDSFTTLFASPISHIQKLIASGGNFFSTLSQLFTWLPAPVQTVLGSSLALVLVIGVIKLLL